MEISLKWDAFAQSCFAVQTNRIDGVILQSPSAMAREKKPYPSLPNNSLRLY